MLASSQMPVQQRVAKDVGVAQSLVSRARSGRLRRITPKVRRLIEYATTRVESERLAEVVAKDLDAETHASFSSEEAPPERRASSNRYRKEAIEGVKAYLKDGYDPRLIVEQLAVLRRAQQLRRPGPRARDG